MWFSCFRVLPGSAKAQVTSGGIVKRLLIAYFIGKIFAKKYQNPFMFVKVIASQRWDVFLRHGVYIYLFIYTVSDRPYTRLNDGSLIIIFCILAWLWSQSLLAKSSTRRKVATINATPAVIRFRSLDHYIPLTVMLSCIARDCGDADGHLFDSI